MGGLGVGIYEAAALLKSPGSDLVRHVVLFSISFAFYLGIVLLVLSTGRRQRGRLSRWILAVALGWAVLLRVALLGTTPSLSDDVFRYVWDGRVAAAGIDPYRYPPASPELASLRDSLWNGINAKSMVTPYPPLAEGLFALVYRLSPNSLRAMQVMAVVFDLGVMALLLAMLARLRQDLFRVLIYAWNPLVIVQFAHSGHFDAEMILPLLGALYFLARGNRAGSGIMLGISTLAKVVPAITAPVFLPMWGVPGVIAAGATLGLGLLPLTVGPALTGLLTEATYARFNDSANYVLMRLFGLVSADPGAAARLACDATLFIASILMAAVLWRRRTGLRSLLRSVYYLVGLFILLNAVVEPWYLTWMVPFLCFVLPSIDGRRSWLSPSWGWLLLSGSIVLTDITYLSTIGNSAWVWIRVVEYGPVYGLIALWIWRNMVRRHKWSHEEWPSPARS